MKKSAHGFTLVELLVVIAIIAVLAAVVVLIVNPIEITKRSRDATRLADLVSLQSSINVAVQEAANVATLLCVGGVTNNHCTGRTHDGTATVANSAKADGTGWVKIDLAAQPSVSIPALPVDPSNTAVYHYLYCANIPATGTPTWEVNAVLESTKYTVTEPKMANDGGDNASYYEVGSKLSVVPAGGNLDCPF